MTLALLACGVGACSSDSVRTGTLSAGTVSLTVATDPYVNVAGGVAGLFDSGLEPETGTVSLTMTSTDGRYSHTWNDISDFPRDQYFLSGLYDLSAVSGDLMSEGFDKPSFSGKTQVDIIEGANNEATLTLALANSLLKVNFADNFSGQLEEFTAIVHTPGGLYHTYGVTETRSLCLNPGEAEILLDVTLSDSRKVSFVAYDEMPTIAGTLYNIYVSCIATQQGPEITVTTPAGEKTTLLSEEFLNAASPVITTSWQQEVTLMLPEGNDPIEPYTAEVMSSTRLKSLVLSTLSTSLCEQGMPRNVDLLHTTAEERETLSGLGLSYDVTALGGKIDLTRLLGNLIYLDEKSAISTFSLMAIDTNGKSSEPVSLTVNTSPVDIEVLSVDTVTMCVNRARIEVKCPESGFMDHVEVETCDASGEWVKTLPLEIERKGDDVYVLSFDVEEGSSPVDTRLLYCNEVRTTFTMPRTQPRFTILVDAYATSAAVKIMPSDTGLLERITSNAHVYINGNESPIYAEVPERGILSVIGLNPNTTYEFSATLMTDVPDKTFTPVVSATTESTPQLPNADFEERNDGVTYKNLPSGGRYSQTVVEIFNWQHSTSYAQEIPKQWANTNAKTFNMSSDVFNTWYMQPSVALTRERVSSQSFAVELTSVGFDPHGLPIPDYTQTGTPYLDYSPIVPDITYKAAGKLFLGQYSFDAATMSETYNEGIAWTSRPSSLNGYYCYYPIENDRSDCGLVKVEVMGNVDGKETVIATGTSRLTLALSYTAFSVPLTYDRFGVKATRIKVMFSSSVYAGTIEEESSRIKTVDNPLTATSIGGKLWIDDVTLAY